MTGSWFERLENDVQHDWQRATRFLHHADPTIGLDQSHPPRQETAMSLKQLVDEGRTLLEDGEAKIRQFLDQHAPQIGQLADLIEANPVFGSVERALAIPELAIVVDGFAKALDALVAAHPSPAAAPEAPAAPEQAAEPQLEHSAN